MVSPLHFYKNSSVQKLQSLLTAQQTVSMCLMTVPMSAMLERHCSRIEERMWEVRTRHIQLKIVLLKKLSILHWSKVCRLV